MPPDLQTELVVDSLADEIERLIAALPTNVTLETTDLTNQIVMGVVQAVQGLKGPATAEEIAEALARRLAPQQAAATELPAVLSDIRDSLKKMDNRVIGLATRNFSGAANIPDRVDRKLGIVQSIAETVQTNITNTDVRVTNVTAQEIGTGKFNIYGSGKISLSVAGNFRATLKNPATSGKTIKVHRISAFGTSTGWATIIVNPTTGLPATAARPSLNAIVGGGVAGIAEVKADSDTTAALGGGTDTGIVLGIAGGSRTELNLPPLIVAPGVTLGFNVPFAGAADVTLAVYTTEV